MNEIIEATASVIADEVMKKRRKWEPAFEAGVRCEHTKWNRRCPATIHEGETYCTQHKPATPITVEGDSRTNTAWSTVKSTVNNTLASAGAAVAAITSNTTKEESTMETKGLFSTIKATVTSVKESKFVKWVKRQASALATKKAAIAIGSFSAVVGGIVTASCGTALAVGAAVAALITAAAHAMTKKKEQSLSYKAMLSDMGVAVATVAVMPAVLFMAAYVGAYATVYGAILPYAIIVA